MISRTLSCFEGGNLIERVAKSHYKVWANTRVRNQFFKVTSLYMNENYESNSIKCNDMHLTQATRNELMLGNVVGSIYAI